MYEWAEDPHYSYDWLKDVYDYLKTYEDVEIQRSDYWKSDGGI